jgi:Contractile injection system tube protein
MTGLTSSPRLIKGGLVVLAPGGGPVRRMIALQYNPDTLTRTYQVQGVGGDGGGERAQPFRLKGPAIETIKLDAEIDATDQLEFPDSNANTVAFGIAPQLATLEALVNPSVDELLNVAAQSANGTLEIIPPEAPLVLFIWSKSQVVPVRVTEFSVTEEAFDPALNPLRAKVSLGLRVMSTDDLGFAHKGGTIFLSYLRAREALAGKVGGATLASLGVTNLP